jgi:hypothetical protein
MVGANVAPPFFCPFSQKYSKVSGVLLLPPGYVIDIWGQLLLEPRGFLLFTGFDKTPFDTRIYEQGILPALSA